MRNSWAKDVIPIATSKAVMRLFIMLDFGRMRLNNRKGLTEVLWLAQKLGDNHKAATQRQLIISNEQLSGDW